jgi:hypothetical protein
MVEKGHSSPDLNSVSNAKACSSEDAIIILRYGKRNLCNIPKPHTLGQKAEEVWKNYPLRAILQLNPSLAKGSEQMYLLETQFRRITFLNDERRRGTGRDLEIKH